MALELSWEAGLEEVLLEEVLWVVVSLEALLSEEAL